MRRDPRDFRTAGLAVMIGLAALGPMAQAAPQAKPQEKKSVSATTYTPPKDQSLTAAEYAKQGVPAIDKTWTSEEMAQAFKALGAIAQKNPAHLPRAKSPHSGQVFARITADEGLKQANDPKATPEARLAMLLQYQMLSGQFLLGYLDAYQKKGVGDTEIVDLLGYSFRCTEAVLPVMEEFLETLPEDDPQREARVTGLKTMKMGLGQTFSGGLTMLTERGNYRPSERIRLIGHLRGMVPTVVPWLPQEAREVFLKRLTELAEDDDLADLQPKLGELLAAYRRELDSAKEEKAPIAPVPDEKPRGR